MSTYGWRLSLLDLACSQPECPYNRTMSQQWLLWIQKLQAIAQNGLRYSKDPFNRQRFQELREISAHMLAGLSNGDPGAALTYFESLDGTSTPRIDVRAFVLQEGKVLMVREKSDGLWTLPGGWADVGCSLSEAVAKEVHEEAGYVVAPTRILAVYDRSRHPHPPHPEYSYKIFVQCDLVEETTADELETDAAGFFPVDRLPPLSTGRVTSDQIGRMVDLADDPSLPADFD